jgi:hypothetical protein
MTRVQAAQAMADDARAQVCRRLRELRELVNRAESETLADMPPRLLPIAVKTESVEEAVEIWEACRESLNNATTHLVIAGDRV